MKKILALLTIMLLSDGTAAEKLLFRSDFNRNDGGWRTPAYWGGKLEWKDGCLHLAATENKNRIWGRAFAGCAADHLSGGKFQLKMRVKGSGDAVAGFLLYPERGKAPQPVWSDQTIKLNSNWQDIEFLLDLSEKAVERFAPFIELKGNGYVCADDVTVAQLLDNKAQLKLLGSIPPLRRGDPLPELKLSSRLKSTVFTVFSGKKITRITSSPEGILTVPPNAVETDKDGNASLIAGHGGDTLHLSFHVTEPELYARFEKAAAKLKLNRPLQILYLGDSLLDFDRGANSADKLNYWINRGNPGKASFRNFAVRGDTLRRVVTRLQGNPVYHPRAYDGMLKLKPDMVFIWLGHNDTAAGMKDNFLTPAISPAEQKQLTAQLLRRLRSAWPETRFVFISPTSLDSELQHSKARNMVKAGRKDAFRFGDPDKLEAFHHAWRKSAEKAGAMYIDVYQPVKNLPDKKKLFKTGDGVHLNAKGCDLIALLWLEALGSEK